MAKRVNLGVEEARRVLPRLIDNARQGQTTVITRHGKAHAALVPVAALAQRRRSAAGILSLRGSGRGLFGDAARAIDIARREWD
ncbi:MAG: type II toxin-antitoxin system prevent-host-death family antitoxin [Burkholderiales bacterium]